jgi:hypothetical protein
MAYDEKFQMLIIHLQEVSQALHKGDKAIVSVPQLTIKQDLQLLHRITWMKLKIAQAYKLSDPFRMFERF